MEVLPCLHVGYCRCGVIVTTAAGVKCNVVVVKYIPRLDHNAVFIFFSYIFYIYLFNFMYLFIYLLE